MLTLNSEPLYELGVCVLKSLENRQTCNRIRDEFVVDIVIEHGRPGRTTRCTLLMLPATASKVFARKQFVLANWSSVTPVELEALIA